MTTPSPRLVEFNQNLHAMGLRNTPQRTAVLEYLDSTDTHPSAAEVYSALKQRYPGLSFATVYNTLDLLVGMGYISVLGDIGDNQAHFDSNIVPHANLVCVRCHSITDIHSPHLENLGTFITQESGFEVVNSRILYYGLCPVCQQETKNT